MTTPREEGNQLTYKWLVGILITIVLALVGGWGFSMETRFTAQTQSLESIKQTKADREDVAELLDRVKVIERDVKEGYDNASRAPVTTDSQSMLEKKAKAKKLILVHISQKHELNNMKILSDAKRQFMEIKGKIMLGDFEAGPLLSYLSGL